MNTPIQWFALDKDLAQEYGERVIEKELDYHNPVRFHNSSQVKTARDFLGEIAAQSNVRKSLPALSKSTEN